jgi:dihydrofolate reductase
MTLSIIAALSENGTIGRNGDLPWRIPADLRRFKALTMGRSLIVGRRTFESIGRALPGRRMVVVTRQAGYRPADVLVAATIEEAIERAGDEEIFIGGGGEIYQQTVGVADRLYLTTVKRHVVGDTFFPPFDPLEWRLVSVEDHINESSGLEYSFSLRERLS